MEPRLGLLAVMGWMALALALLGPELATQQLTSAGTPGSPPLGERAALVPLGPGQLDASRSVGAASLDQGQISGEWALQLLACLFQPAG